VQTPNYHLNLFTPLGVGWREDATAGLLLDENMALIDAAIAGGGGGAVTSVYGRTGAILALTGDYAAFYDALGAAATAQAAAQSFATAAVATETARATAAEAAAIKTSENFAIAMAIALG